MYLFWNPMVRYEKFFLPFPHLLLQYVPNSFHSNIWISSFNFHTGAGYHSNLWTILPPSCFNKTSCLVFTRRRFLYFDMRSLIWVTLAIFSKLIALPRDSCSWGKTIGQTPSSTPHTIRHPQTRSLRSLPRPLIPWFIQTPSPNKRRLDQSKTTLRGLVFSWTDSHHHSKVRRPSTSSTTTHTATTCHVHTNPTNNQTIKLGRRTKTESPLNPNQRIRWRKLRWGWLNLDGG